MQYNNLKGTGVALVTPFHADGSIDFEGLRKLVRHQINNGTDYLVIMGTTGESPTISEEEKKEIIRKVAEENNGKLPLVLGVGGNDTSNIVNKLKSGLPEGINAILSVSPYYNKPNQQGIAMHYQAVADASPVPVILYNVPGRTGMNVTAETQLKLAEHSNIVATKEASGNFSQCMEIIQHKPDGFLVISGDDAITLPFLSIGMDGVISVICNAFPKQFSQMVALGLNGNYTEAQKIHYQLLDSMNLIFADGSPGGIKVILRELGICGDTVRLPLANVNKELDKKLAELAKSI